MVSTLRRMFVSAGLLGAVAALAPSAAGQDDNPPSIIQLDITVVDSFSFAPLITEVWTRGLPFPSVGDVLSERITPGDVVTILVTFQDSDLIDIEAGDMGEPDTVKRADEDFYTRARAPGLDFGGAFFFGFVPDFSFGDFRFIATSPSAPLFDDQFLSAGFIDPPGLFIPPIPPDTVFDPNVPLDRGSYLYVFTIPTFIGPSQARLRGEVPYDVGWSLDLELTNQANPEEGVDPISEVFVTIFAREDPRANSDPPPQADAGASPSGVRDPNTGVATAVLNAGLTTDASNIGFDQLDPDVLAKNTLRFTWELIAWPPTWTPNFQIEPFPDGTPRALVTLANVVEGQEFTFRVLVDDDGNPLPSAASVTLRIQAPQQDNEPPVASAGPDLTVTAGSTIRLDGSASTDPEDGAGITYLWRQTNAVGGPLDDIQLQSAFQPVAGLSSAVSLWRALLPGTYYFRLIVTDSEGLSDFDSVTVVVNEAALETAREVRTTADEDEAAPVAAPILPGLCGAGVAPVALAPLALALGRRRRA